MKFNYAILLIPLVQSAPADTSEPNSSILGNGVIKGMLKGGGPQGSGLLTSFPVIGPMAGQVAGQYLSWIPLIGPMIFGASRPKQ
jgi:hypothetical protein